MGAYLSSPICDKDTIEGSNNRLTFAASSMQGWRMSQEDAHNAILNFDDKTSLFAVYDGHGGAEIAVYCSRYLPSFLKKLDSYKEGRYNDALIECFLKFDSLLLESNVKKILQKLANDESEVNDNPNRSHDIVLPLNSNLENNHNDELNIEEAQLLKKEAELPIEELLKHYNSAQTIDDEDANVSVTLKSDVETHIEEENNVEDKKVEETTEAKPSSSESKSTSRRARKPVSTDVILTSSTTINSNSLTRHLLSDNIDELEDDDDDDEDDFEFDASEEDTSGDEAEDHEVEDENADGDEEEAEKSEEGEDESEDKPLEPSKAAQIQKLMRKSIMAILNRRAKKKKHDADDVKENQNEDDESDEEGGDDDDNEIDEEDEEDLGMLDMNNDPGSSSGCTAVVTLLHDKQLFVANAGDSRCVVCRGGRAIEMSIDHKPEDSHERSRIEKAGYKVTLDGRVSGGLNLSRAIGDHAYKKMSSLTAEEQAITALPDIRTLSLEDQDDFMIIACDGIWNFMSSQDVVDFVRLRLEKKSISQICEELFMHCLAPNTSGDGTGCDNMTAIIVKFSFHQTSTAHRSYSTKCASPTSINNKRSLSPDHISTNVPADNNNSKKFKLLAENGTSEITSPIKPTGAFSIISNNSKDEPA